FHNTKVFSHLSNFKLEMSHAFVYHCLKHPSAGKLFSLVHPMDSNFSRGSVIALVGLVVA
ncbi:hypothetical protein DK796_25915, partial [Escherichia coli]|nr:hypothetical protein [Escherichia coli]